MNSIPAVAAADCLSGSPSGSISIARPATSWLPDPISSAASRISRSVRPAGRPGHERVSPPTQSAVTLHDTVSPSDAAGNAGSPPPSWRVWVLCPILSTAGGLVVSAIADNAARAGSAAARPLLWIGLLTIFVPISIRLLGRRASGRERLLLILILYLALYLAWFLQSPLLFTTHDAMGQFRSAEDIVRTGHLFHTNPIVTAYGSYPGLELATSSLAQVSGLSLFASGVLLLGAARAVLAISFFLTMQRLLGARAAGIASLVYATNLSFIFFDAQFAYESLALPLAMLTVAVLIQYRPYTRSQQGVLALLLICSVVVTHFVTTLWLLILLIAWALLDSLPRTRRIAAPIRLTGLLGSAAALAWFFGVARTTTVEELGPVESSAFSSVGDLISGRSAAKHMFAPAAGQSDGLVLQIIGFLSVAILVILVAASLWHLRRTREPIRIVLLILMLMYPLSLVLRLTAAGTETSSRASEFVFIGIGFGVAGLSRSRRFRSSRRYQFLGVVLGLVLFVGGIVVGTPPYTRLPGPYLVAADPRSIDARTIAAATWVREHLPADSVFAADRSNGLALAAIGMVDPGQGLQHGQSVPYLYFSRTFDPRDRLTIRAFQIRYILVDLRLSTALPYIGLYFSPDEPLAGHYTHPIPRASLTKFATARHLTRIFDDGDIQIYQVHMRPGP
jgi:hypothetical protein